MVFKHYSHDGCTVLEIHQCWQLRFNFWIFTSELLRFVVVLPQLLDVGESAVAAAWSYKNVKRRALSNSSHLEVARLASRLPLAWHFLSGGQLNKRKVTAVQIKELANNYFTMLRIVHISVLWRLPLSVWVCLQTVGVERLLVFDILQQREPEV